jgi:Raf kinase inhibitor-like YbhB/YbcL family protein
VTQNDPFARLPEVPAFTVTSTDVVDGQQLPAAQMSGIFGVPGGGDVSPQLSWSGAPESTRSYAVQMFDPDAPTMSGFWHWAIADIPASVAELATGAGSAGGALPEGAVVLRNDGGRPGYLGAAPPAGHGTHRYFLVVSALDVDSLGVTADTPPAALGFGIFGHVLARAVIVPTAEIA